MRSGNFVAQGLEAEVYHHRLIQGWESECWLDLAKGGWVGRIPLIALENPRFPFHAFWKILIPLSRFSRIGKTDLKDFWHASFRFFHFLDVESSVNFIFKNDSGIRGLF